ncbi:MAG: RluA family pseudouridine synthase [Hyphomicrobiales bacterium]|nr:RluA family pseudouridine synthase [Hyphomicrobiales bacterium]
MRGGREGPRPGGGKSSVGRPPAGRGGRQDRQRDRSEPRSEKFGGKPGGKFAGKADGKSRDMRGDFKGKRAGKPGAKVGAKPGTKAEGRPARRFDAKFDVKPGRAAAQPGDRPGSRSRTRPEPRPDSFRNEKGRAFPARPPRDNSFSTKAAMAAAQTPNSAPKPKPAPNPANYSAGVQTIFVTPDEDGMRVDRWFEARFPGLSFSHIQRIVRKGEVRVNSRRTEPKSRLVAGQAVRIPPLQLEAPKVREEAPQAMKDREFLRSITLSEDDDVLVLNKPAGLAVQGGSGVKENVDDMLEALRAPHADAQRPRLVHRLDKDTAGCLLVAKTRFAAAALAKTFRTRAARKIYWALVAGVPKPKQGRISTYLAKFEDDEDSYMRIAKHGEKDAVHAVTYYAVVETSAQKLAWISLKPVTGRTHQLRAHMAHVGNPIIGDPKYFNIENWELPGGIQNKLHLLARRIVVPHPRGGTIDISAPLPPHMQQSWNLLGLDISQYDPIVDAPEED